MSKFSGLFLKKLTFQNKPKINKSNSSKLFSPINSFLIRKINKDEKSNFLISKEIDDYLYSSDNYFSPSSRVAVGKKIKLLDMKTLGIKKPSTIKISIPNQRMSLYKKFFFQITNKENKGDYFNSLKSSMSSTHFSHKEKQQQLNNDKYEIIDNEQLKKIFNKYKTLNIISPKTKSNDYIKVEENNNTNNNINNNINNNTNNDIKNTIKISSINSYIKKNRTRNREVPLGITKSLSLQNKKLEIRQALNSEVENISKNLSKLLNKDENDLLLNQVDCYNLKKELLNEIDVNKPSYDKYGKFNWNINLRKPKYFKGVRNCYINLTKEQNPFWGIVVEKYPKIKELKIKPGTILKNKKFFEKFKKTYFPFINSADYKNFEKLDSLNIKGENLYDVEYNREIRDNKNKKILHKAYIDKGGKVIMKTDINNIFGEKTFYENYNNNNNLLSNNSTRYTNSSNNNSAYNTFTNYLALQLKKYSKNIINLKDLPKSSLANDEINKKTLIKNIILFVI